MVCTHCGREVNPTIHSKNYSEGFKVDYYSLVTGDIQPKIISNPSDESEKIEYFKLENLRTITTCIDCFKRSDIQAELEEAFSGMPEKKANG